jgi:hypothetical protein
MNIMQRISNLKNLKELKEYIDEQHMLCSWMGCYYQLIIYITGHSHYKCSGIEEFCTLKYTKKSPIKGILHSGFIDQSLHELLEPYLSDRKSVV